MPNIFHKNGKTKLHFQMDIFAISIFNIIEKVSSAKAEKIEESNSIYYSKLQWCPLSACLTPIINRKKIFLYCITTFMYNHIISSILIYFSSNLIYLLLILLYHAINKKRRFLQTFSLFFSCRKMCFSFIYYGYL